MTTSTGHCLREGLTFPIEDPKPFCTLAACRVEAWHSNDKYKTPTTCYEAKDSTEKLDLTIGVLYAEGMNKIWNVLYPDEIHDNGEAFWPYDEPLYPIPVGASVYYFACFAWMTTFYYTYLGRKFLANVKHKMDLHPEVNHFPNLPLYWIQQSKREADLRREVRNTWAWLARRYLLSPNDPLLANVDQVLGLVNWHDFEVSRTTWSLIKVILTVNALYVKVRRDRKEKTKNFEIIKDINLAKRKSMEEDPVQLTRVFEVFGENEEPPPKREVKKEPEKPKKVSGGSHDLHKKTVQLPAIEETTVVTSPTPTSKSRITVPHKKPIVKRKPKSATASLVSMPTSVEPSSADESHKGHKRKRKRRRRKKKKPEEPREWRYFYHRVDRKKFIDDIV